MSGLESWLADIWYGDKRPPWILRILSRVYARAIDNRKPIVTERMLAPVVVVGNFTVGGTGKTPLIIALAQHFVSLGYRPGVVSRGYGRKSKIPVSVDSASTAEHAGDEPLLIARRTALPIRVDSDRYQAARFLIEQGCNIIISDDGMQHRTLPRTLEIEVVDMQRGYGNGLLLPAGPLREPVRPVDIRVINGLQTDSDAAYAMQLSLNECWQLAGTQRKSLQDFAGHKVQAVAGIGNPQRFFDALAELGILLDGHAFADHHQFVAEDLPRQGPILMTEKDAVKCKGMQRTDIWVVPVEAQLSAEFYSALSEKIANARGVYA